MNINKDQLIEDIAQQLCDTVDMKTLLYLYYDDQVSYMRDMEEAEILEWAESYLGLSKEDVETEYYIKD